LSNWLWKFSAASVLGDGDLQVRALASFAIRKGLIDIGNRLYHWCSSVDLDVGLGSQTAANVKDYRPRDFDGDKCDGDWDTADMTTVFSDVRFRG